MSPDEEEDLLRSFLNEVADAEPSLQAFLSHRSKHEGTPGNSGNGYARQQGQPEAAQLTAWTAGPLRRKLRELSALHVSDDGPSPGGTGGMSAAFAVAAPPGLVYAALDALVRLVSRLLLLVDPASSEATRTLLSPKQESADAPPLASLVDLTLLCLANLAERPSWRHVFFRVLHEVQLEQQQSRGGTGGGSGGEASTTAGTTLQEYLWRRVVVADKSTAGGAAMSEARPSPAPAVDLAAVRLCCSMVRHCPLSFSASSYASLAPYLAEYLLGEGGGDGGGSGGGGSGGSSHTSRGSSNRSKGRGGAQTDLMVVLDLFAACARGSPHFRQYVKGLRRKRELFRRLLGLLGPMCDGKIVVRALCALTRVLAGDPLEGKVFDRGNALETASLVIDNLLDLSGCSERVVCVDNLTPRHGGAGAGGSGRLGEQRRFADVASDLARSQVFTSVLVDTGRLASFLGEAVAVLARAAADVFGRLSTDIAAAGTTAAAAVATERRASRHQEETTRPEPLLRALCSFCLEHSPARSTFIQALLDSSSSSNSSKQATAATARTSSTLAADPCAALFVLCLHPHPPSAAAASTLLQCLLVGGGALGAVSGPSTGAAAGVGVIPAGFLLGPTGVGVSWAAAAASAGIGREDPLQAALLERIGAVALGGDRHSKRTPAAGRGGGAGVRRADGSRSSDESDGSEYAGIDDGDGDERSFGCGSGLEHPAGLADAASFFEGPGGGLSLLVLRLRQIGGDLASAQAKQKLGLSSPSLVAARPAWPVSAATGAGALKARAVEMELELTSVLCLLSSLALAVPAAGRALARALPLEAAFGPVLAAQRCVLCGTDPADFSRAPVEIVLVSLTLIAQLGVELSGTGGGSGDAQSSGDDITASEAEEEEGHRRRARRRWRRRQQRQGRQDAARAARLRRFLGEQAAAGEVKLCLGHAACRAESKDLARRAAALISLLQAGGGADALLVADSLYAFAQAAEAREGELRSRAAAAEAAACRERAAGARRAAALDEAEGLVAQIESRNAEDIRRLSEQESGARRRLEDSHARAVRRGEVSLRRAEENVADLERVLSSKEEALGCAGREARAKDLEIAALRGDLAGEQRLRAAVTVKLEAASAERDELSRGKAEAEAFLEALKEELSKVREEGLVSSKGWEDERANAARGWAAAREAEEGLELSNGRVEEVYGKLILLARGYKGLEEDSRCQAVEGERLLVESESKTKLLQEQAREEERRHRLTKAAAKDGEASLRRAEQRLAKVSEEAAEAQAAAGAAKAAVRELVEKAASADREAGIRREEVAGFKAELERLRAACAEKDVELANKSKELGQQAGIIDYINKLSSNAAAEAAAAGGSKAVIANLVPAQAVTLHGSSGGNGDAGTPVPASAGQPHVV